MPTTVSSPLRDASATPLVWQGRHIGDLIPGGTWRKAIDSRRHWARKHDAPGFQAEVWESVRARGLVERVEVFDRATGCTFRQSAEQFEANAIRDTLNVRDGEQLFAPRHTWHVEHPDGFQYSLPV